jgi:hypothetical protein
MKWHNFANFISIIRIFPHFYIQNQHREANDKFHPSVSFPTNNTTVVRVSLSIFSFEASVCNERSKMNGKQTKEF